MYGIVNSAYHRNQHGRSWVIKAIFFTLSSALVGMIVGTLLGFLGGHIPASIRVATASILALVAVILGISEVTGHRVNPLQRNRETPQRWVHAGAISWAILNGSVLGLGAVSRIGFWLWYVVPVASLLLGRPVLGLLVYGAYGFLRGLTPTLILLIHRSRGFSSTNILDIIQTSLFARKVAAVQLTLTGLVAAVILGF